MTAAAMQYSVFETAAGFCGIAWTSEGVARFQLPTSGAAATERLLLRRAPDAGPGEPPDAIVAAIDLATRYFGGERIDFSPVAVDLSGQDELYGSIYAATRRLGFGETTTYGALARALGHGPEVARDVGRAMARNPVPLVIPCHRVLAAGGKVGGFSAPGGAASKIRMLRLEGVDLAPPEPAQASLPL